MTFITHPLPRLHHPYSLSSLIIITSLHVLSPVSCRETTQQPWPVWRPVCLSWPELFLPPAWTLSAQCPGIWFATSCIVQHPWAGWFTRLEESMRGRRLGLVRGTQHWFTIDWVSCSLQVSLRKGVLMLIGYIYITVIQGCSPKTVME